MTLYKRESFEHFEWGDVSPHFAVSEIFSPETINATHLIDVPSLRLLNEFREALGRVLIVNYGGAKCRGVRSSKEQERIYRFKPGAALNSMHVQGKAFDISSPEMTPDELYREALAFGWSAAGLYPSFVHVDTRTLWTPTQTTWRQIVDPRKPVVTG